MTLKENISVALESIKANLLRAVLTSLIIAIGIMALVGILTSIDGIKSKISGDFASMGANSFNIRNRSTGVRFGGRGSAAKKFPVIDYRQALAFKQQFNFPSATSVSFFASFASTLKYGQEKTNPNISVAGADENYLSTAGYTLAEGRNITADEALNGAPIVIIGKEIQDKLFNGTYCIGKIITIGAEKFRVIGTLKEKGTSIGFGGDKGCIIPLQKARQISTNSNGSYTVTVAVNDITQIEIGLSEATAVFRNVRHLSTVQDNNFEITKSDSLANTVLGNLTMFTLGATFIGLITLLGASIGLMNIMLVSVTERTREIGIRKSLGATPEVIRRQFLIEAITICQIGGIGGIILGVMIGNLISVVIGGGFIIPWLWILGGITLCVGVGLAAGMYPAIKASKLDPVEALRYE